MQDVTSLNAVRALLEPGLHWNRLVLALNRYYIRSANPQPKLSKSSVFSGGSDS
jgi:hypothetical protein